MKNFLLQTIYDGAELPKCSISLVHFVAKMLIGLGFRLSNLNSEVFEFRAYERGLDHFTFILRNIKTKSLLSNVQLIDDLRNEMLRFHKVISYCSLLRELQSTNVKKTSEMDKLCGRLEHFLFIERKYSFEIDSQVDELFHSLIKITINKNLSIIDEDVIRFVQMDELTEKLRCATLLEEELGNICDNNNYCC